MKKTLLLIPALLMLLLAGCLKDDPNQGTIVLLGTESDVKPIEEVIPDTLLSFISNAAVMGEEVIQLPTGCTPPDIQGEYLFFPRELYKENGHHPSAGDTLFLRFGGTYSDDYGTYLHGQHNRITPGDLRDPGFSQQSVKSIYLMGEGNDFTAYFTVNYDDCYDPASETEYTLTRGYILTGTVTSTGIDQAVVACVNIAVEPHSPSQFVPLDAFRTLVDRIYIYRVQTTDLTHPYGLAIRRQWY